MIGYRFPLIIAVLTLSFLFASGTYLLLTPFNQDGSLTNGINGSIIEQPNNNIIDKCHLVILKDLYTIQHPLVPHALLLKRCNLRSLIFTQHEISPHSSKTLSPSKLVIFSTK